MKEHDYTCVLCPRSCRITVEERQEGLQIRGNQCRRGDAYGRSEHLNPQRTVTTTVALENGILPRLPVMSTKPVPKALLRECLEQLYQLKVEAPVRRGDVIVKDILATGADIVATRDL